MSKPFETTKERRANLVKLARFLYTEPIEARQFDMDCFNSDGLSVLEAVSNRCNSAGCAIGWAPNAGVLPEQDEDWDGLCDRALIEMSDTTGLWSWCFSYDWDRADNTAKGASKRILWLLVRGLPTDWHEQIYGNAPLCYADWLPTEEDWTLAATAEQGATS
jgi:hypothetical protein